jgi:broad specificity phosphatase PhoE
MSIVNIASLGRDVELKPYTRAIARAVNEELLKDVVVSTSGDATQTNIPALNASRSEEIAVRLVSGLSQEEFDGLMEDEYEALKKAVNDRNSKKK